MPEQISADHYLGIGDFILMTGLFVCSFARLTCSFYAVVRKILLIGGGPIVCLDEIGKCLEEIHDHPHDAGRLDLIKAQCIFCDIQCTYLALDIVGKFSLIFFFYKKVKI